MKKLALLALIPVLVSCGKDSGGSSQNPRQKIINAFSAIQRGQTSSTISEGVNLYINDDGTTSNEPSKEEGFTVVLRVEGSRIYKFEKTKDLINNTEDIEVSLESFSTEEIDRVLKLPNVSLNGSILNINFSGSDEYDFGAARVTSTYNAIASIDLDLPLCESSSSSTSSGTITVNGSITNYGPNTNTSRENCGPIMTAEEMRKIDLTSVTFCDQTQMDDESYECELSKDMSWLTADL